MERTFQILDEYRVLTSDDGLRKLNLEFDDFEYYSPDYYGEPPIECKRINADVYSVKRFVDENAILDEHLNREQYISEKLDIQKKILLYVLSHDFNILPYSEYHTFYNEFHQKVNELINNLLVKYAKKHFIIEHFRMIRRLFNKKYNILASPMAPQFASKLHHPKIKWLGKLNGLTTLFADLQDKENIISCSNHDLANVIYANFYGIDDKAFDLETIRNFLNNKKRKEKYNQVVDTTKLIQSTDDTNWSA